MEERLNINIGIVGCVSAGKSTLLNSLLLDNYSSMNIRRSTLIPQLYHEYYKKAQFKTALEINKESSVKNEDLLAKLDSSSDYVLKKDDCCEMQFFIPKIQDLKFIKQTIDYTIYDIPGLNDGRTKDIYYDYLKTNFNNFDIILYVIDINSGLNTSDEMNILKFIMNKVKHYKDTEKKTIHIIPIINKCDDMTMESGKLNCKSHFIPNFQQIINTINDHKKKYDIVNHISEPVPLSLKYSYIYRMIESNPNFELSVDDKYNIGFNEMGKRFDRLSHQEQNDEIKRIFEDKKFISEMIDLTGFNQLTESIKNIMSIENQYSFCYEKITNSIDKIMSTVVTENNVLELCEQFIKNYKLNIRLNKVFEEYEKNLINIKFNLKKIYGDYKSTIDKQKIENIQKMKMCMEKIKFIVSESIDDVEVDYNNIKKDIYSYYESYYEKQWNLEDLIFIISEFHDAGISEQQINKYSQDYISEYINKNINIFNIYCSPTENKYNYMLETLQKLPIDKGVILQLVKHFIIMKINNLIEDYKTTGCATHIKMLFQIFVFYQHNSTKNLLMAEIYSYILFHVLAIDKSLLTNNTYYKYDNDVNGLDKTLMSLL